MLRLRKDVNSLTATEKANLVSAIKALKANGKYDQYVNEHDTAMNEATLMPGENPSTPPPQNFFRNVAHRGPAFGPWHREMLRRFELDLQAEVPGVTLPYWNWAADSQLTDPKTAAVWGPDLMGGDGDPNNTSLVATGPFRYDAADPNAWQVVTSDGDPGPGLRRTLGQGGHLPTQSEIATVLNITPYDSSPWRTVSDPSFRNQLEGFMGPNLHNNVHLWVGGSMLPGTSPNDPVFFLHHCNVDRLWWQWQIQHPTEGYVPTSSGPPGHDLNDQMTPWDAATTPASTLNIHELGYYYDTDPPLACSFVIERSTLGQDEIDARRGLPGGAVVPDAFRVTVDGFAAAELGITGASSTLPVASPIAGMTISCTGNTSATGDYGPEIQRFTFHYDIDFGATDTAFGFASPTELVTLNASAGGLNASAQIELIKQPDPFILHGDPAWLSIDLRVFVVRAGETTFGRTMGSDASAAPGFIQQVVADINSGNGSAGGESFTDLSTDEEASALYVYPTDGPMGTGTKVFNFALAKVHYIGLIGATNVRVFFRLFQAQTTSGSFDYPPGARYRRASSNPNGQPIPLPGIQGNEYVTIPCFAAARVDSTAVGMDQQTDDPYNVRTFTAAADGSEVDQYYGCWLDINQPVKPDGVTPNNVLPAIVPATFQNGPFTDPSNPPLPIQQAILRSPHQCLIAEIAFDPVTIPVGKDPGNWDKLAQRNLAWSDLGSGIALTTFEVRPTPVALPQGQTPDELMIDWRGTPTTGRASIYLPAVDASNVLKLADRMYPSHGLSSSDPHTLHCRTHGITYIPIPAGSSGDHAGLLSVDLPDTIRRGESFDVIVRQLTNAFGKRTPPPPPPRIELESPDDLRAAGAALIDAIEWRRVLGAFQLTIPVKTKRVLLEREERLLSVFRWIAEAIPLSNRWHPVFVRFLEQLGQRVTAFGGDPTLILPSPTGEGKRRRPHEPETQEGLELTGKISGLIFDHFGDFEGFLLETTEGQHRFRSRELDVAELTERAWRERLRVTVIADDEEPDRPLTIIIRKPPARFER